MATLSYVQNNNTIINNMAITPGRIYHATDTNRTYYDNTSRNRIQLSNVSYVATYAALTALSITRPRNTIYVVTGTSLIYIYNHNNVWQNVLTSEQIPSYLLPTEELLPITLEKDGVSYAPRTMLRCVYNSNGESLDDLVNFKDASTSQRGTIILYDNYDSTDLNTAPTSNALNKLFLYLGEELNKARDSDTVDGLHAASFLQYSATNNIAGYFDKSAIAPTGTTRLNYSGYLYATRVYNSVYNDYAEYFEKNENDSDIEIGDVVVKDSVTGNYKKSTTPYDKKVVGVYSGEYGQCLGGKGDGHDEENYISVGLAGRVHVKVVGSVEDGDLLVSSSIPGVAMKCENYTPGTVIGKCLQTKTDSEVSMVRMLIMNI